MLLVMLLVRGEAAADPLTISAFLSGGNFLQSGEVTNSTDIALVSIAYSLGAAAPGIATWEPFMESPAGTRADQLTDGHYYQTFVWSGLNVAPGATFSFDGLDIDYIVSVSPLDVNHLSLDVTGDSLRHASLTAWLADGTRLSAPLTRSGWMGDQRLSLVASPSPVPEPSTLMLFAGGGLAAARRVLRLKGRWSRARY